VPVEDEVPPLVSPEILKCLREADENHVMQARPPKVRFVSGGRRGGKTMGAMLNAALNSLEGYPADAGDIPKHELDTMCVHRVLEYYQRAMATPGALRNPPVTVTPRQGKELLKYMLQRDDIETPPYGHHIGLVRDLNVYVEKADDKKLGVYNKYQVKRTDGRDVPGAVYVVLDVANDERAAAAAKLFGSLCLTAGYEEFGTQLMRMCNQYLNAMQAKRVKPASGGDDAKGS